MQLVMEQAVHVALPCVLSAPGAPSFAMCTGCGAGCVNLLRMYDPLALIACAGD
jgi:hypothetical protein